MSDKDDAHKTLFAFIGPDQFGSGIIGLKAARVPAGIIPMVAIDRTKLEQPIVLEQMQAMVDVYGQSVTFARYQLVEELYTLTPGSKDKH